MLIRELRWRVENNGLYQSTDGGPFRRIASRYQSAAAMYVGGLMSASVSDDRRPQLNAPLRPRYRFSRDPARLMAECIGILRSKLRNRVDVIDVNRRDKVNILSGGQARGFKLPVRGLGTVFAIKPHHLRRWLPGAMPLGRFIAELDLRGWLIRGADGVATRQIVIPGYGRYRFYCIKLSASGDAMMSVTANVLNSVPAPILTDANSHIRSPPRRRHLEPRNAIGRRIGNRGLPDFRDLV